ncbi:DUF4238 domain-containing protein [Sphingobium yanoikuyae]|jgi:Protein of unknown function (DUF4238)|uniref:DUF4238 domain-containing protein n=1 Tax=Sphingobium yanoikuyae TaxID=13690 RepID=UPI001376FA11|nr:DUF4238 domain-containing protein [Sphingobium yanoikuyae]NBB41372.1 DUF4238 domain-containing protein [Sphingobium yanoikuyae]
MSIPRKHHYLPQFYLERWTRNGELYRYVRPQGADGILDCKRRAPKAVAYERDLYQMPNIADAERSQFLEMEFFQRIDDRAAIALRKVDSQQHTSPEDRVALAQFMISLLHRSPSRLATMRTELAKQTEGAPYNGLSGATLDTALKSTANQLLALLIGSKDGTKIVGDFRAFRIDTSRATRTLLTSDRPVTVSAQLISDDAFMILPYAPDRLLILTHLPDIARSFASQRPNDLVTGINQAVVEQSEDIIVGADDCAFRMVDRLFLRPQADRILDSIGLIRRKSPLVRTEEHTTSVGSQASRAAPRPPFAA